MGSISIVPFLDLNLIKPKPEPFNEPLSFSPNPNPNFSNPQTTPHQNNNLYSEFNTHTEHFTNNDDVTVDDAVVTFEDADVTVEPEDSVAAIVPVSGESRIIVAPRKIAPRSSELVRVSGLRAEDERYYRDVVRRTRMLYDSLRVFSMFEEAKNRANGLHASGSRGRGDVKAAKLMMRSGLWLNRDKRIVGSIPGVYVGDLFNFRVELCVLGLHGQTQAGIDFVPANHSSSGEPIATSIVVSGGYEDDHDAGEELIYTGQGGQDKSNRQISNQKLEGGNLAMERSMHYGLEVRVIRGFEYVGGASSKVYVYDGLYTIVDTYFDIGISGFGVYKFKLVRNVGQPEMGSVNLRLANSLRIEPLTVRPFGYLSFDLSLTKENVPVFLYNDIDNDHEPLNYDYLPRTVFPPFVFNQGGSGTGCNCVSGCIDNCACAMKNGGEFPYDHNGILVRGKPLIFECGPFCRCPPKCRNRVSQKGVRRRFEVFRSRETGWGVRSLDLILAGSFICEYAGVYLSTDQADVFTMNGDSVVYPNRFTERWAECGDLSKVFSDYSKPAYPSLPPLDFAIDLSRMRNVACYMSHSSFPNVMVQSVLYDHNNMFFPHLMLFAMEHIPPLRELSLDYGVADEWTGKPSICN